MNDLTTSVKESLAAFKKDKWLVVLSMFPIMVGVALFSLFGKWVFTDVADGLSKWIENWVSAETWGNLIQYVLIVLLSVGMYVVLSFTFVLIVSLIASPFNDIISSRVETLLRGKPPISLNESFAMMAKKFLRILGTEVKKIGFILSLTLISVVMSFFPLLAPVSALFSAILLAINFLDYSWSRNEMPFGQCFSFIKSNFILVIISGFVCMFFMSIPIVNLFALPFSVIFFTVVFTKRHFKISGTTEVVSN